MSAPTVDPARADDGTVGDADEPSRSPSPPNGFVRWLRNLPWEHADDWLGLLILVACCVFVLVKLQPELVIRNTTPNGGDLGAHVWWPAYLRDHLLPFRLSGWSPDFYAGFPAGQYYFPVPALSIVGLDVLLPYNIAFKLVVVAGPVLVPVGAYVLAKGLRAPNPTPAAMAVAITSFLFFTGDPGASSAAQTIAFNQRIMGGTLASTLAGEFSFTIALAFALLFFGTLAWSLRTRAHLWLPALLLALCLTSHLMVGIFAGIGAFSIWVFYGPLRNFTRAAAIGVVGVLISAVWLLPLLATMSYTTDMRYGALGEPTSTCKTAMPGQCYGDYLFPRYFLHPLGWEPYQWGGYVLIGIAIVAAVGYLRKSTFSLLLATALCGLAFRFWTELGTHVWNLRLLSFWYIGLHLLMAIGVAELIRAGGWLAGAAYTRFAFRPASGGDDEKADDADAADAVDALGVRRAPVLPAEVARTRGSITLVVTMVVTAVLAFGALRSTEGGFIPYWAKWNFTGYENTKDEVTGTFIAACTDPGTVVSSLPVRAGAAPFCEFAKTTRTGKQFPEYRALLDALDQLPRGRLLWEGGPSLDKYGTPLSLMLIPYWTDGRITTMEGVYFEASGTTPYHFEAVSALVAPGENSNPVRDVPYRDQQSFDTGVRYLQALGVNYFIAHNPTTKAKADADPRLTLIASSPDFDNAEPLGWNIYRVADAPLVEGLAWEPVVATGVATDPDGWEQKIGVPWWYFPDQLDAPVAADGPAEWKHAAGAAALRTARRAISPAQVSNIRRTEDSISFDVDRVGVPVLVKESYFPNWKVDGADGPYRATPNFMVVVPTEKHVTLEYGTTKVEWLGRLLTLLGLVGLAALVWWGRKTRRPEARDDDETRAYRWPDRVPGPPDPQLRWSPHE